MARKRGADAGQLDIYVLGAGASRVHGAPLVDGLLPHALTLKSHASDPRFGLLREFLSEVFHFQAPRSRGRSGWNAVPGLVDVLSMVDVALDRKESLSARFKLEELRDVREAIEAAIFLALEDSLAARSGRKPVTATSDLVKRLDPACSVVISFNYDLVVDVALAKHLSGDPAPQRISYEEMGMLSGGDKVLRRNLDYGVEFANLAGEHEVGRFRLLKLHGSLNWLRHRITGDLYYGGLEKAVGLVRPEVEASPSLFSVYNKVLGSVPRAHAPLAEHFEPVMVTPTHLKDLRNPHLSRIWRQAEVLLRQARSITFIGYSLPGDDLHVKYLFKRALETRPKGLKPPRIHVVDKGPARSSAAKANYERFFGRKNVTYEGRGFAAWVATLARRRG